MVLFRQTPQEQHPRGPMALQVFNNTPWSRMARAWASYEAQLDACWNYQQNMLYQFSPACEQYPPRAALQYGLLQWQQPTPQLFARGFPFTMYTRDHRWFGNSVLHGRLSLTIFKDEETAAGPFPSRPYVPLSSRGLRELADLFFVTENTHLHLPTGTFLNIDVGDQNTAPGVCPYHWCGITDLDIGDNRRGMMPGCPTPNWRPWCNSRYARD